MRTIFWFILFWVYLLVLSPKMARVNKLTKNNDIQKADELTAIYVKKWAQSMLDTAGVKLEVTGLENIPDTPCVFVSNHQGNFDIPVILAGLDKPHALMAKIETLKIPLIRTWMRFLHCVFVDRKDARKAVASLNECAQNLKNGHSVVIFPEGTRAKSSIVGEFKAGSFKVAGKAGVPIVPICLEGTYKAMEANKNFIRPATVKIKILPSIETAELSREDLKLLPEKVRQLIIDGKKELE